MTLQTPLSASDPRLRHGRYEVTVFGPKNPTTTARKRLAGPFRFETQTRAELHAIAVDRADRLRPAGTIITIDRVAPRDPRHLDGPWQTTNVRTIEVTL